MTSWHMLSMLLVWLLGAMLSPLGLAWTVLLWLL